MISSGGAVVSGGADVCGGAIEQKEGDIEPRPVINSSAAEPAREASSLPEAAIIINSVNMFCFKTFAIGEVCQCSICLNDLSTVCIECSINVMNGPGHSECRKVSGVCNHVFHSHCIGKWLKSKPIGNCPICATLWEATKYEDITD
jgi:RING-box protein 1